MVVPMGLHRKLDLVSFHGSYFQQGAVFSKVLFSAIMIAIMVVGSAFTTDQNRAPALTFIGRQ